MHLRHPDRFVLKSLVEAAGVELAYYIAVLINLFNI